MDHGAVMNQYDNSLVLLPIVLLNSKMSLFSTATFYLALAFTLYMISYKEDFSTEKYLLLICSCLNVVILLLWSMSTRMKLNPMQSPSRIPSITSPKAETSLIEMPNTISGGRNKHQLLLPD